MSKSRTKKPVMAVQTMEQVDATLADYATVDAKIEQIKSKMDEEITAIRAKYADELSSLNATRDESFNAIQVFAETHPDLFDKKKSINLVHGNIGFRLGNWKVKLLAKWKAADVVEQMKKVLPNHVRVVEEINKEMLIGDRENSAVNCYFHKDGVGINIVQDETFYIELKKENESNPATIN